MSRKLRIKEFKERIAVDGREFCLELFNHATLRLLAHKYAYYVLNKPYIDDTTYDLEEKTWYVMGRALKEVEKGCHSPCVEFDKKHPLAKEAIRLAKNLARGK